MTIFRSAIQTLTVVGWQGLLDLHAASILVCDIAQSYFPAAIRTAGSGNIFLFVFFHGEFAAKLALILTCHAVARFVQLADLWQIIEAENAARRLVLVEAAEVAELQSIPAAPVPYRLQELSIKTLRALGMVEGIKGSHLWSRKPTAVERLTEYYQGCGLPKSR